MENENAVPKIRRITIVIPGMNYGGMERVAFIMQDILLKNNYDVQIVTLFTGNPDYKPNFEYISLNCEISNGILGKLVMTIKRVIKMKKYKKKYKPDIVITFGINASFANIFSKCGEKVFVGIRSYDWLYQFTYSYLIDKYIYKKADKVISVSKLIKEDAERIFNIKGNKSYYLYNPYDVKLINKKSLEKIDNINIPKNKKIIVSVGRLENQKGFYHLIKSISLLNKDIKDNISLIIIGNGTKHDALNNLIQKLHLQNCIFLVGGMSNPYKVIKNADLFVMSSITEGFPNALVEAMALGIPVLSSDCKSGPREILTNDSLTKKTIGLEYGDYGLLVQEMTDSRNYDSDYIEECDIILANSISKIIYDSDLLVKYGKKAKNRAELFTYERFEKQLLNIINDN